MTSDFAGRVPTLWHGEGIARQMMERLTAGRETLVVADAAVAAPFLEGHSARTMTIDAPAVNVAAVVTMAQEIVHRSPSVIVAVGGGTVLDASKIAALALARGRAVFVDEAHGAADHRFGEFAGVGDGGRAADKRGMGAVEGADAL